MAAIKSVTIPIEALHWLLNIADNEIKANGKSLGGDLNASPEEQAQWRQNLLKWYDHLDRFTVQVHQGATITLIAREEVS